MEKREQHTKKRMVKKYHWSKNLSVYILLDVILSDVSATDIQEICEASLQVPINKVLFVLTSCIFLNSSKRRDNLSWSDCYRWRWSCRLTVRGSIGSTEEDERQNMDAFVMGGAHF